MYVAAIRVDPRRRQSPYFYDNEQVKRNVRLFLAKYPDNRLYRHLANCALNYNCLAAKNLFLERWEAPLPVARFCNAKCLGCLSLQASNCPSPQERIRFKPTVQEAVEIIVNHLMHAKEPIVSFGQGCEGEPLLEEGLIAEGVKEARAQTSKGTIHLNTNASIPQAVRRVCKAGVDSVRVSLNSVVKERYLSYFRPQNYTFADVLRSIKVAKDMGKFISLNLFVFPGITDLEEEVEPLFKVISRYKIDMVQLRNLNIDYHYYLKKITPPKSLPLGILNFIHLLEKEFPRLKIGYFNVPVKTLKQNRGGE